jgi:hypothetical protein
MVKSLEKISSFISLQPISLFRWNPCSADEFSQATANQSLNKILLVHGHNKEWLTCWNIGDNSQTKKTIKSAIIHVK